MVQRMIKEAPKGEMSEGGREDGVQGMVESISECNISKGKAYTFVMRNNYSCWTVCCGSLGLWNPVERLMFNGINVWSTRRYSCLLLGIFVGG